MDPTQYSNMHILLNDTHALILCVCVGVLFVFFCVRRQQLAGIISKRDQGSPADTAEASPVCSL